METRYLRNLTTISEAELKILASSKVLVVGCGGLGGYIIEMLSRIGIGHLTIMDPDTFDETNLNRQILSHVSNIGKPKVDEANNRIKIVNPSVHVIKYKEALTEGNAEKIIKGHHIVMDAVDNISTRLLMEKICEVQNIPLIHGAIAGWYFQVSVVMPGDKTLSKIYSEAHEHGIESAIGNPSFIPAAAASFQVSECIKVLLNKEIELHKKLMYADLLHNTYQIFEI
jgi:molybdopterin-synthase adenylyltransferase